MVIGGVQCIPLVNTDTQIIVAMPTLPFGTYNVQVEGDNGYAYPAISVTNTLSVSNISAFTGSNQGNIIMFTGQGFPNSTNDSTLQIFLNCNSVLLDLELVVVSPASMSVRIAPGTFQHCEISLRYQSINVKYPYSTSPTLVPNITLSP